ncbi:MAG: reverse gyrase [Acidilobaceae archaeon]
MAELSAIFKGLCPNCGGDIEHERLIIGAPCSKCLSSLDLASNLDKRSIAEELRSRNVLTGYLWIHDFERKFEDFASYVYEKTGFELWSAQRSWAKRLLEEESFAIVAPTGVGKTTLLQLYACYRCEKYKWRVLYLAPTENLVRQVYERLSKLNERVIAYFSNMNKKMKEEVLAKMRFGDFCVLVVTPVFLRKRFNELKELSPFDLAIVDDVDSLLRDSRNVERLLEVIGVPREAVETAVKLIKTKRKLFVAMSSGRDTREEEVKIAELENSLRRILSNAKIGQLVIASATVRPRGTKHLLFREVLGFETGGSSDYLRNVKDALLLSNDIINDVVRTVELLGKGGIVFVSQLCGGELIEVLVKEFRNRGLRAEKALAGSWKSIIKLERGEVDVLVAVASRYGVAVRGLDAPQRVRYVVFVRAPAKKLEASKALLSPSRLLRVLIYMAENGDEEALELARDLRETLDKTDDPSLVQLALRKQNSLSGVLTALAQKYSRALEKALSWLSERARQETLRIGTTVYIYENGTLYAYIPDALTYIQASGRASRMLNGKMTFGLSVVVEPLEELVRALEAKASWIANIKFEPFNSLDLERVLKLIEETRRGGGSDVKVDSVLLVVESPTKAKTIAWFWGSPAKRKLNDVVIYETSVSDPEANKVYLLSIVATRGHLFDMVEKDEDPKSVYGVRLDESSISPVYSTIKRCRSCGFSFVEMSLCPRCGSTSFKDSRSIVEALRRLALQVDHVIVATDPDREGEKIAWDVMLVVAPYNKCVYRARFYEVTRDAVLKALRNLSAVDERLVASQIARRVIDRWIGFHLSGYLKAVYEKHWLGAGRVQTPVLGWVISRYLEWKRSRGYRVCFEIENGQTVCFYVSSKDRAQELALIKELEVVNVSKEVITLHPPPPYTTDALLSDAAKLLRLPVEQTMRIAQELFEAGLITYHRTDSTRVSEQGMVIAREYLVTKKLESLFKPRAWSNEGAHEAIRPTKPLDAKELEKAVLDGSIRIPIKLTWAHKALYDLIFRRFVASQMREAEAVKVRAILKASDMLQTVEGVTSTLSEGFTAVLSFNFKPWLEKLREGSTIAVSSVKVSRGSSISLLTSGEVVKLMKEKGIGRPSTYHKALEANKRHGYIIESKKVRALIPTKLGIEVYRRILETFPKVANEEFTKALEEQLDAIEQGTLSPLELLENAWREIFTAVQIPSTQGLVVATAKWSL